MTYSVYIKNIELHGCTVNINMKLNKTPNKHVSKKSPNLDKILNKKKRKTALKPKQIKNLM